jgi:hypothetical protein
MNVEVTRIHLGNCHSGDAAVLANHAEVVMHDLAAGKDCHAA